MRLDVEHLGLSRRLFEQVGQLPRARIKHVLVAAGVAAHQFGAGERWGGAARGLEVSSRRQ